MQRSKIKVCHLFQSPPTPPAETDATSPLMVRCPAADVTVTAILQTAAALITMTSAPFQVRQCFFFIMIIMISVAV